MTSVLQTVLTFDQNDFRRNIKWFSQFLKDVVAIATGFPVVLKTYLYDLHCLEALTAKDNQLYLCWLLAVGQTIFIRFFRFYFLNDKKFHGFQAKKLNN